AAGGTIVNVSSDAAVEAYAGWGGYGSSKAALDQAGRVMAAEHPALRVYGFDPGDMRTDMHQRAFPVEDISDRPEPETMVPARPAAAAGHQSDGREVTVHLSTRLDDGFWLVELRPPGRANGPVPDARPDERFRLPDGVELELIAPYPAGQVAARLWCARVAVE